MDWWSQISQWLEQRVEAANLMRRLLARASILIDDNIAAIVDLAVRLAASLARAPTASAQRRRPSGREGSVLRQ